jgi:hypothetical protein
LVVAAAEQVAEKVMAEDMEIGGKSTAMPREGDRRGLSDGRGSGKGVPPESEEAAAIVVAAEGVAGASIFSLVVIRGRGERVVMEDYSTSSSLTCSTSPRSSHHSLAMVAVVAVQMMAVVAVTPMLAMGLALSNICMLPVAAPVRMLVQAQQP